MSMENKVWMITGCSSGFGKAIARAAITAGYTVVVTARDASKLSEFSTVKHSEILVTALDVTSESSVRSAVEKAIQTYGRIDVLVNNAGYGYYAIFENLEIPLLKDEMEVNLYGVIRTSQAVLPIMRQQRSGRIINISSIAGSVGTAGRTAYSASKFAASGISDCLATEVKPFGIRVTAVELGSLRTNFFDNVNLEFPTKGIGDYEPLSQQLNHQFAAAHGKQLGNPELAAKVIIGLSEVEDPPLRIPLGIDAIAMLESRLQVMVKEKDTWKYLSQAMSYETGTGASG